MNGFKFHSNFLKFKLKIIIGMSPRQPSREFYNQKQRSVLGFGIFSNEKGLIICRNVDLISHNLNQTGNTTVKAFV